MEEVNKRRSFIYFYLLFSLRGCTLLIANISTSMFTMFTILVSTSASSYYNSYEENMHVWTKCHANPSNR